MSVTRNYLAEETRFVPAPDEHVFKHVSIDEPTDWGSDPMEILMAKQEHERLELEAELSTHH